DAQLERALHKVVELDLELLLADAELGDQVDGGVCRDVIVAETVHDFPPQCPLPWLAPRHLQSHAGPVAPVHRALHSVRFEYCLPPSNTGRTNTHRPAAPLQR